MKKILFALLLSVIVILFVSSDCNGVTDPDGVDSYETYTITPEGGSHTFDCGIQIDVPEGAVTEETDIQFRKMETSEIQAILEPLGRESSDIIVGFEAKPDGLTFLEDVKITVQNAGLEPSDFVVVHELDVDSNKYTLAELSFVYDPPEDMIEFSLNHFCGYSAEVLEELEKKECVDDPENCRCRDVNPIQADTNVICDLGDCQKTVSRVTVEYRACGITETSYIYELSEGCEPEISLTAGRTTVAPEENTTITAELILGCEGLEGQVVDFSVSNLSLGSVSPTNQTTDGDGKAQTTFTAGEEERTVTVTVNATVSYYMSVQETSGEAGVEVTKGPMRTKEVTADIDIKIEKAEWEGNFKAGPFSGCTYIACIQNYSVEIDFTMSGVGDGYWEGYATVTQSGNVTAKASEDWLEELNMPVTFSEDIWGSDLEETKEIIFDFLGYILIDYFDWVVCGEFLDIKICSAGFGLGFADAFDGTAFPDPLSVVLEGDEVTKNGQCMLGILGLDEDITEKVYNFPVPYTLTIKR